MSNCINIPNLDDFRKQIESNPIIESDHIHFRIMRGDYKERMLFNYLTYNFFIDIGYNSPILLKGTTIHRTNDFSPINNVYGKNITNELNKIFCFGYELTEEVVKYWLSWNCKNLSSKELEDLWEDQMTKELMLHWSDTINRMREEIRYFRTELWNSVGIPPSLMQG